MKNHGYDQTNLSTFCVSYFSMATVCVIYMLANLVSPWALGILGSKVRLVWYVGTQEGETVEWIATESSFRSNSFRRLSFSGRCYSPSTLQHSCSYIGYRTTPLARFSESVSHVRSEKEEFSEHWNLQCSTRAMAATLLSIRQRPRLPVIHRFLGRWQPVGEWPFLS